MLRVKMSPMKYPAILCTALGLCAFSPLAAFAQAGFDCAKASTDTEKAICKDSAASEADRAMSLAYNALIERSDSALKEALRKDQSEFNEIRSQAFENQVSTPEANLENLTDRTEMRAEFLNWVSVSPDLSIEGNWRNAWGMIKLKRNAAGHLDVDLNVADQISGSWVCQFEGSAEQNYTNEAEYKGEGGPLTLQLEGAMLKVPTPFCDESTSGGAGSAAGTYFRVGE